MTQPLITRFAPSPTGYLHIGHALSAHTAWAWAKANKATFLLRIEDIDTTRCKPEYTDAIIEDLTWLGIGWDGEVIKQSERFDIYNEAIQTLKNKDLLYPCFATRKDISYMDSKMGVDGLIYSGLWRDASADSVERKMHKKVAHCQRIKIDEAYETMTDDSFMDMDRGKVTVNHQKCGDVILVRKDTPTSYHLAVCVDDHFQGVTHVIRGEDLFAQTNIHRILQDTLGYKQPIYMHHRLITDDAGKKFSKTDKSLTIRDLRDQGYSPTEVLGMAGINKV